MTEARWLGLTASPYERAGPKVEPATPTYQLILGWAQGIAIGMGVSRFNDEMSCWQSFTATTAGSQGWSAVGEGAPLKVVHADLVAQPP